MRNDARLVVLLAVALCVPGIGFAQSAAAPANSTSTTVAAASSPAAVTGPRKFVIGTDFASGSFSKSAYENSSDSSTDVYKTETRSGYGGISPNFGIFLNDTLLVGSAVYFSFSHSTSDSLTNGVAEGTSKYHSASFSVGPFLRKYLGNPQGRGMPFVHVEGGIGFNIYGSHYTPVTGPYAYDVDEQNYHSQYFEALLGYEMFLTDLLGLQYYGGFERSWYSYDNVYDYETGTDSTYHYKGHSNDVVFGIGLKVYLHRKR